MTTEPTPRTTGDPMPIEPYATWLDDMQRQRDAAFAELARLTAENTRLAQRAEAAEKVIEAALPIYQRYHQDVLRAHSVDPESVIWPPTLIRPLWQALRSQFDPDTLAAYDQAVQQQP